MAALAAGCSDSTGPKVPAVARVVVAPPPDVVVLDDTVRLHARALARNGNEIPDATDGARVYLTDAAQRQVYVLNVANQYAQTAIGVDGTPRLVAFDPSGATAVVTTDDGVVFIR